MLYYLLYPLRTEFIVFNLFKYITFRTFGALMTALILYLLLGKRFIAYLRRNQVGQFIRDEGPKTHFNKKGTPTMGGLLILFCTTISVFLWGNLGNAYLWLTMFVLLSYGAIGFYDDYKKQIQKVNLGLKARLKFPLQVLIAALAGVTLLSYLDFSTKLVLPFFKDVQPDLGWFYVALICLVVTGASNAVNLTDGLDGLVAVPNVMAFSTYAVLVYVAGNKTLADYLQVLSVPGAGELAIFCGALVGGLIGFLWFNSYPAEIFMGDTGSLSIGAALGMVAILAKAEILLILVGGIFVLETVSVMTQVISFKLTGKRIFKMAPIHHHFELKGWPEPKVIVRFWIISFILSLLSLATLKIR
ncbi:phospho-N-acetylmuramoyl-pentapeptide-transferase [Deltaproteobacteria bacterium PRO3]|nr:phospho-N-acetylmuramoyl-pentapeptide-transferase [Deltaproteobacteria bacterium PRO3]